MTLKTRLALWYSGLLMVIIIIFSVAVITISRVTLLRTVDQILDSVVNTVQGSFAPVPGDELNNGVSMVYYSDEVFHSPGISVQIWRTHENGEPLDTPVLERSSNDIVEMHSPLDPNYLHTDHITFNSIMVGHVPERVISRPFHTAEGTILGVIQVGTPLNAVADANDQLLVITLVSAVICIAASIGPGMWLSQHLLKPIDKIKHAAASVADAEDLTNRIEWDGVDDELGQLTRSFNHMMGHLEHLFKVQQDFIGDVSHELRTPLTSIIGHLEIMDKYGVDDDSMKALHREARRMSRMVNDLLLLTRADSGELSVDFYPVDLDVIGLDVFAQIPGLAGKRKLKINIERIETCRINGNSDRIRQLMLNLLNNAIKFTEDGGEISLSVYPDENNAIIEVRDSGIGISKEDTKRIFDRFFQADSARVYRDDSDGAGLGLSIVRWIVDIHKGHIEVDSEVGKGTTFKVTIPAITS